VMVGMGWTGSIMARELTKAGLSVVGLERGAYRAPAEDFALPGIRDELKYRLRLQLMLDNGTETITMRHTPEEDALPMRRWGAFSARRWRRRCRHPLERRHLAQSAERVRAALASGAALRQGAIPADLTVQDWGVTYDELEPYYERFEKLCGTSGKAGNLRGTIQEGGNPFEGPRMSDYPNKPLIMSQAGADLQRGCEEAGLSPFLDASSNNSAAYTNNEGQTLGACQYCGHCEYFGCESNSKASPNICLMPVLQADKRFELRAHAYVKSLVTTSAPRRCAVSSMSIAKPARSWNSRPISSCCAPIPSTMSR